MSKIPQQVIPLAIIFLAAIAALIVARTILVPDSFGDYGFYRADAVGVVASAEIHYAGAQVCAGCHDDIFETKQESYHHGVSCEVCHGPAAKHAEEPDEYTPDIPRSRTGCSLCHSYNPSRPSGFPQIQTDLHNPGRACIECHNPHAPILPHPPDDCSACHREIVNQKVVSPHATLACTVCHEVPKDHWANPASVKAHKPREKAVCGQCHGKDANSNRTIPRVDLDTHGDRYLCWDCHYPHSPEAHE